MSRRTILAIALLAGLCLNTLSGLARILGFYHRHRGEMALSRAELDSAFAHLSAARRWQPGDAPTYVLLGRVVHHAQANGLPLEALEGHEPLETFGVGLAAVLRGIALNPADAWAWFNLVDVHQGFRASRVRLASMKRAGEAATAGPTASGTDDAEPAGLGREDRASVAALFEALELEPEFYFYHDYLAKLYWDRGLRIDAAREIRQSFTQWPRLGAHPVMTRDDIVKTLAEEILAGIEASSANPFVGPVLAIRARADLLERLGRTDEAITAYEALRKIGDRTIVVECDLSLGKLEIARGRYRESLPILRRVLDDTTHPGYPAWAHYYMGLAHSNLGEHDEAVKLYRRHLEMLPDSLSGYFALAAEEEIVGRSAEAERLYIAAVVGFPSKPVTYLRAIDHLRRHGKAKQAISYAEALRKVGTNLEETEALIEQLEEQVRTEAAGGRP